MKIRVIPFNVPAQFMFALIWIGLTSSIGQAANRWYEVEVLVFAQTNPDWGSESWPDDDRGPLLERSVLAPGLNARPAILTELNNSADTEQGDSLRSANLPMGQMRLSDTAKNLSHARGYRTLVHTAWKQQIGTGKDSFRMRIAGGKDYSKEFGNKGALISDGAAPVLPWGMWELDGFVKLSASQYLHVESDLVYRSGIPATAGGPVDSSRLHSFRLNQTRRVKSNELSYFDHPLYGLLIQLRPLEPENRSNNANASNGDDTANPADGQP